MNRRSRISTIIGVASVAALVAVVPSGSAASVHHDGRARPPRCSTLPRDHNTALRAHPACVASRRAG
jgi:hypothetical protein